MSIGGSSVEGERSLGNGGSREEIESPVSLKMVRKQKIEEEEGNGRIRLKEQNEGSRCLGYLSSNVPNSWPLAA